MYKRIMSSKIYTRIEIQFPLLPQDGVHRGMIGETQAGLVVCISCSDKAFLNNSSNTWVPNKVKSMATSLHFLHINDQEQDSALT